MSKSIKFKDEAYLDSSSIVHNKELLSEYLAERNNLRIYSTIETKIGTWIDGKPIYRKVINVGKLTQQNNNFYNHNITNLGQIVDARAIGYDGTQYYPIPFAAVSSMFSNKNVGLRVSSTQVSIGVGVTTDFQSHSAIVILEYTKTTD